jgi:hypothetical protein
MQDYVKDSGSIAKSFLDYTALVDRGLVDIFDVEAETGKDEVMLKRHQINNILHLALNRGGYLKIGKDSLQHKNNDFVINTVQPTKSFKEGVNYQMVVRIKALLQNKNLIINYNCI